MHARTGSANSFTFETVRVVQPSSLRVAAWNVQRGGAVDEIAARLRDLKIDVALLSECDIGMARSGNRDTVAEIADRLGMYHACAVEFRELGLGNAEEREGFVGQANSTGLHVNAVLSRHRFRRVARIVLDDGDAWLESDQPRIGGRNAVAAEIDGVWYAAAHLESRCDPEERERQMRRLTAALSGADRAVIGGDFNTRAGIEPLFATAEVAGFGWADANVDEGRFAGRKLDFFFVRGVRGIEPAVHDASGISDHDLITLTVVH